MTLLTDAQLASLRHHRGAEALGHLDIVSSHTLGCILAEQLIELGLAQDEDDYSGAVSTYRCAAGVVVERVRYTDLRAEVRVLAITALEQLAGGSDRAARFAQTTLDVLARNQRGAGMWMRIAVTSARDRLPSLGDEQLHAFEAAQAQGRRAQRDAAAPRDLTAENASRSARSAQSRAAISSDTRDVLVRWLPTLPPGRHLVGDVWASFEVARRASAESLREKAPGALAVGKTVFYALLAEVGVTTAGGGHRKYLTINDPSIPAREAPVTPENALEEAAAYREAADQGERLLRIRELLAAGKPHAALILQRDGLAATGTEGSDVVDLATHRARRR